MYCNKCGKEIIDDSNFCSYCGSKIEEFKVNSNESSQVKKKDESTFWVVVFFVILSFAILMIILVSTNNDNVSNNSTNNNIVVEKERPAEISDIIITFHSIDHIFETDEYYMKIQAQEEIINLKLSVDYKDSNGRILKTEIVNVGKIVPGNNYQFKLSLNGMDPSDLDKVSKFAYKILNGKVIE